MLLCQRQRDPQRGRVGWDGTMMGRRCRRAAGQEPGAFHSPGGPRQQLMRVKERRLARDALPLAVSVFAGTETEAGLCQIPSPTLSTTVLNSDGAKKALKIPTDNSNNCPIPPACTAAGHGAGPSHLPPPWDTLLEKETRETYLHAGLLCPRCCSALPDVRSVEVGSVLDHAVGYILSASLALGRPSVGLALLLPLYGRCITCSAAPSYPPGERGKEEGEEKGGRKKIKRIFITMKEAGRISQWKTHQPEIPA